MPQHATRTSYKPGYSNPEARKKQSATLKEQYRNGLRVPPVSPWTDERRAHYAELARAGAFARHPVGATRLTQCGSISYVLIKTTKAGRSGWRYEHRHVMEEHLGRPLTTKEHVHHINGNSLDNRLENLQLIDPSAHKKLHPARIDPAKLRLPEGQWARKHSCCVLCGETKSAHRSKGRCARCHERERRASLRS